MEPTGTILKIVDSYGLVNGMAILLLIFTAVAVVYQTKRADKKDLEAIESNDKHAEEMKEIHQKHTDEISEILKENREDRKSFISALHENSEAINGIRIFNEQKFNGIEKDLGEIKLIVNKH